MPGPIHVAAALAQATRELRAPQDVGATLQMIVSVACDSIPHVEHVSISVSGRDGEVVTRAASDAVATELDEVQYAAGEGPCLHAIETEPVVRVEDARHEQRWPLFMPTAVAAGLRSHLSVRLDIDTGTRGSMNLYSVSSDTISAETEQLAELFAAHAGLALGHARRLENLTAALENRRMIGLALGMTMQRLDLDEDAAFAYLTRISGTTQTKLRDVAADLVARHRARLSD